MFNSRVNRLLLKAVPVYVRESASNKVPYDTVTLVYSNCNPVDYYQIDLPFVGENVRPSLVDGLSFLR